VAVVRRRQGKTVTQGQPIMAETVVLALIISVEPEAVAAVVRLGQLAALKMAVLVLLLFSIGFSRWRILQD
jgi:uncharacterized membrane protein